MRSKSGRIIHFVKNISPELDLCLEYDESTLKGDLNKGTLSFPDIYIVLINSRIDKKEVQKPREIGYDSPNLLVLGELKNPFIKVPCSTIDVFFAKETFIQHGPAYFERIRLMRYDQLPDGNVHIHNDETFGQNLRRHQYFYTAMNKFFTVSYLNFLKPF